MRDRQPPTTINLEPTTAQMEKLVKFLEENPEIATGTDHMNNESLRTIQKWEAIAKELNMMGGANRSGDSWAEFWDVSRSHLNHIIADRKFATGARGRVFQPCTPGMMERMIMLLEGPGHDGTPAESPSTSHTQGAQQTVEIEDDLDPESNGNVPQTKEDPSTSRAAASSARRASRRTRRTRPRAIRPRPLTAVERLIKIEEGRLQVNLKSAEILNSFGATAERLEAFIAACGHKIAAEIERRNTPN